MYWNPCCVLLPWSFTLDREAWKGTTGTSRTCELSSSGWILILLYSFTGIEASDLSSLLEQFEKSEGEGI